MTLDTVLLRAEALATCCNHAYLLGLREALEIIEAVEWHDGTPAHYVDNWMRQAVSKRISELENPGNDG